MKKIADLLLLLVNIGGIFIYLKNASLSWALPNEAGLDPALGGVAMVWGLGALPILFVFVLVNGCWWYFAKRGQGQMWPVIVASVSWIAAVIFDFTHH